MSNFAEVYLTVILAKLERFAQTLTDELATVILDDHIERGHLIAAIN